MNSLSLLKILLMWFSTVCARGQKVPSRLLVVGPYVEFSLCGEVVIAAMTWERPQGRVGIWAETGDIALRNARVASMRRPTYR